MIRTREHLAWHVAGHAYAATMWGFPVHKLSLDGFTEADLEERGDAQRLDPPKHAIGIYKVLRVELLEQLPAKVCDRAVGEDSK